MCQLIVDRCLDSARLDTHLPFCTTPTVRSKWIAGAVDDVRCQSPVKVRGRQQEQILFAECYYVVLVLRGVRGEWLLQDADGRCLDMAGWPADGCAV